MHLQQRQTDGKPLRAHLLAAAANGATPDPRILARPPEGAELLWEAFCELAGARPSGMAGDKPVPPSEVQAWQAGRRVCLSPWDLDTLAIMDRSALALAQELQAKTPRAAAAGDDE